MTTPVEHKLEIYQKVGHLCMAWANLDDCLDMLIGAILGCTNEQSQCISTQVDRVSSRLTATSKNTPFLCDVTLIQIM